MLSCRSPRPVFNTTVRLYKALIFTCYRPREPHSARESSRDREMTSDGGGSHRAMPSAVFKTVLTVLMFFICLLHWILYSALAQGLPRLKSAVEIGSLSRGFSCVFTFTRLWAIAASKILRWVTVANMCLTHFYVTFFF